MNRDELILVISATLFGAVLLGWILRWIYSALNNEAGPRSIRKTADLASRLTQAEAARQLAESRLREVEHDLPQRLRQMQKELDTSQADLRRSEAQLEELRYAWAEAVQQEEARVANAGSAENAADRS